VGNQNWRNDIQKKLNERNIIAMESVGILNANDVSKALNAIDKLEAERDEAEEWRHIEQIQNERKKQLKGAASSGQRPPVPI